MVAPDELLTAVREILFRNWDPIGVSENDRARHEYDSYAPTICRYLRDGADEFKLTNHLRQLRLHSLGLTTQRDDVDAQVARQLLALVP